MGETYTFSGDAPTLYMTYADADTDAPLVATPGESYGIRATGPQWPVPPSDGRWAVADPPADLLPAAASADSGPAATDDTPPAKTSRAARAASKAGA